jgi:ectoine hydroxylase-related dioxygenase (phytanoyl-CoA dioxygenase family)
MMPNSDSGFQIIPKVFHPSELTTTALALEVGLPARSKAGARHLMRLTAIRALAGDERLLEIGAGLLGRAAMPFRATLFDKSTQVNWLVAWHQDTALPLRRRVESIGWGPWSVKAGVVYAHAPAAVLAQVVALRVHLDDSTSANGPLRVLPGTHTLGVLSNERIAVLQRDIGAVECLVPAGGVVAMRPLLVHASSKSRDRRPRRVIHIEYAAHMELAGDLELSVA